MRDYKVTVNGKEYDVSLIRKDRNSIEFQHYGKSYEVSIQPDQRSFFNFSESSKPREQINSTSRKEALVSRTLGTLSSPMPGIVIRILVKKGDSITSGQVVAVIEAMKMENAVKASRDGVVKDVYVTEKQEVASGAPLIEME